MREVRPGQRSSRYAAQPPSLHRPRYIHSQSFNAPRCYCRRKSRASWHVGAWKEVPNSSFPARAFVSQDGEAAQSEDPAIRRKVNQICSAFELPCFASSAPYIGQCHRRSHHHYRRDCRWDQQGLYCRLRLNHHRLSFICFVLLNYCYLAVLLMELCRRHSSLLDLRPRLVFSFISSKMNII